jgi:Ca2+-binding RTX toxin-like protein
VISLLEVDMRRLRRKRRWLFLLGSMVILILTSVFSVFTASNNVSGFYLDHDIYAANPSDFLPQECIDNGITFVSNLVVVSGSGSTTGTTGDDLILGTGGNDTGGNQLKGSGGNDCLVGGGGADILSGGKGFDVLVGGAGDDTLNGGQDDDILLGGSGDDDLDGGHDDDYMDGGPGSDVCDTKHGTDTTTSCETITN